jgi:hypothetical protein
MWNVGIVMSVVWHAKSWNLHPSSNVLKIEQLNMKLPEDGDNARRNA